MGLYLGYSCWRVWLCYLVGKTRGIVLELLKLDPERFDAICFVALGNSTQSSAAVDMDGSCKYWLDENENFLVPKRTVDEIFLQV